MTENMALELARRLASLLLDLLPLTKAASILTDESIRRANARANANETAKAAERAKFR